MEQPEADQRWAKCRVEEYIHGRSQQPDGAGGESAVTSSKWDGPKTVPLSLICNILLAGAERHRAGLMGVSCALCRFRLCLILVNRSIRMVRRRVDRIQL